MTASYPVTLTVVMPAYNEEDAIGDAVRDVQDHVLSMVPAAELLVVDDGSRDQTGAILEQLAARDPRIRVLHRENGGHGRAVIAGLDAADGEFVFLIDSDRQVPLTAFPALWEAARNRDGALGIRRERHDPGLRLVLTAIIRMALWPLFGIRLFDANVPFKIVRLTAWKEARALIPDDCLAPSLFLAIFLLRRRFDVAQRDVPHAERRTGVGSIRGWKLLKFCAKAFFQLLEFRARLDRTKPGRAGDQVRLLESSHRHPEGQVRR